MIIIGCIACMISGGVQPAFAIFFAQILDVSIYKIDIDLIYLARYVQILIHHWCNN